MSDLCADLRQVLVKRFNESEMQTLAADLGVELADLPGATKTDKARELVAWFERRQQLGRLVAEIGAVRQDIELLSGGTIIGCKRVRIRRKMRAVDTPVARSVGIDRQVERLADSMDQVRNDVGLLRADVRVLQADMATVKRQVGDLEDYIKIGPPMGRQTVVTVVFGVAVIFMAAALILMAGVR